MKVFISHSSVDKEFVRTVKKDLNANGILTWFDEDQLELGDSLIEKLESGLSESSHFIIVLSQASTNSDWVRYELKKALENKALNLVNKIIPIKYNDCEVPNELSTLLYGDLSLETRVVKGDYVEFYSSEYVRIVDKVCKSIKRSEKVLTKKEIDEIKIAIDKTEKELENKVTRETIKGVYYVNGYKDKRSRIIYSEKTKVRGNIELVRPILLPPLWKSILPDLKIGEKLYFSKNYRSSEVGHFAGFRKDDTCITVDPRIRQTLLIKRGSIYLVELSINERRLNFID